MSQTIWKKAWRDLWKRKLRSFLVIGAIAASTFTLGTVLVSYHLLNRDMNGSYAAANPHHLSLRVKLADEALLEELAQLPEIEYAEARFVASGRIQNAKGQWHPLHLYSAPYLDQLKIDIINPDEGEWPPAPDMISIERQALSVLGGALGERVVIETDMGTTAALTIGGLVHDVVLAQAEWENIVYAYVAFDALESLGFSPVANQIRVTLKGNPSHDERKEHGESLRAWFEAKGVPLSKVYVADDGGHPHNQITSEMFLIMIIFGWFCCIFSSILVVNLLTATLALEKRQIGVMKAMGANVGQIVRLYFSSVICLCGLAMAVSLPFILPAGMAMAENFAKMMNFDIESAAVPVWIFALLLGLGMLLPLFTCFWPIRLAGKNAIRSSLVDYGLGNRAFKTKVLDRLFSSWLTPSQLIALRSTFRRKGRLILNIAVLAAASAFLIASFNVRATISAFVTSLNSTNRWDLHVSLAAPLSADQRQSLSQLQEVKAISPYFHIGAQIEPKTDHGIGLLGIDHAGKMLQLPLVKGRLLSGQPDEILLSQSLVKFLPSSAIGDQIKVSSALGDHQFRIVGVVQTLGGPRVYVNANIFSDGAVAESRRFFLTVTNSIEQTREALSQYFESQGIGINGMTTPSGSVRAVVDHFEIIFNLIIILTLLVGVIGLNGIFSSMSTSLMERAREFGILKAIGASQWSLLRIIILEGVLMGLVGWFIAALIALPMSKVIAIQMGMTLLNAPLPLAVSPSGLAVSLVLVPAMCVLGCLVPAFKCVNRPIRDSLTYE